MKFGINLLKQFFTTNLTNEEIINALTASGLEVESIEDKSKSLSPFIVAKVEEATKHEQSDKLNICKVNTGKEILQVICGASNVRAGLYVAFAPIGSLIPSNDLVIKKANIIGVDSCGMICSTQELNLEGFYESFLGTDCYKNPSQQFNPLDGIFSAKNALSESKSWINNGIIELEESNDVRFIIGESFFNYLQIDPIIIELAITPNRGDCTSVVGVARHLAKCGYGQLNHQTIELLTSSIDAKFAKSAKCDVKLDVKSQNCHSAAFCEIDDVTAKQSNPFVKQILTNCGMESKNILVDASNFVMLLLGKPMHVYDKSKLNLQKSIVIEDLTNSDGRFYPIVGEKNGIALKPQSLVITNDNKNIALAGIMGSSDSAVDENTKNIVVECAYFTPQSVALGIRLNAIQSQSSYRFERGVDATTNILAINFFAKLVVSSCGGLASSAVEYSQLLPSKQIVLSFDKVKSAISSDISNADIVEVIDRIFAKNEINQNSDVKSAVKINGEQIAVSVPQYRHDISIAEDICEEIAICYGFKNIHSKPFLFNYGHFNKSAEALQYYQNTKNVREALAFCGFDEAVNYSFIKPKWHGKCNFAEIKNKETITITNPIHADFSIMRDSLIYGLIKNIALNISFGVKNLKLFEVGTVFYNVNSQLTNIAFAASGLNGIKNPINPPKNISILDIKNTFAEVIALLGIKEASLSFESIQNNKNLNPHASYKVLIGRTVIGFIGQMHPICLEDDFDIKNVNVFCGEIYYWQLEQFIKKSKGQFVDKTLQNVERSLSFVFDKSVVTSQITKAIQKTKQVCNIYITDIFEDQDRIGVDKKSISVDFEIEQNNQTTLTKEQIDDTIVAEIIKNLQTLGGILRDGKSMS